MQRAGGICAIAGAVLAIVVNVLHPDLPIGVREAHALIASRGDWRGVHLGIIAAAMLLSYGLLAFASACGNVRSAGLERFGLLTAIVGASVIAVAIGIDGFVEKALSDAWVAAAPGQRAQYLTAAMPVQLIHVGLFYVWAGLWWGVALFFYGLAIVLGRAFPVWFGWTGVVGGACVTIAAVAQYVSPHDSVEIALRVLLFVLSLWMVLAGVFLWRGAGSAGALLHDPFAPGIDVGSRAANES